MSLIGYARVSTMETRQHLHRQIDALHAAGCERVLEDRASGADPDRTKLAACLDHLRAGDVLVALDLDRLGRRAAELISLVDEEVPAFETARARRVVARSAATAAAATNRRASVTVPRRSSGRS